MGEEKLIEQKEKEIATLKGIINDLQKKCDTTNISLQLKRIDYCVELLKLSDMLDPEFKGQIIEELKNTIFPKE